MERAGSKDSRPFLRLRFDRPLSDKERVSYGETFLKIDQLIRKGEVSEASIALESVPVECLSRKEICRYSHLCFRLGQPLKGLKALHPIVRGKAGTQEAHSEEIIVYSQLLIRVGALLEARELLKPYLDDSKYVVAGYVYGVSHFADWDYKSAISYIRKYLSFLEPASYEYQVGAINLCAALCATGDWRGVLSTLHENRKLLRDNDWQLLLANSYEIEAQAHFGNREYAKAGEAIEKATLSLNSNEYRESLYVKKWKLLVDLYSGNSLPEMAEFKLVELKKEAQESHDWETARDIDFHLARFRSNTELRDKLYYGTSSVIYRERILHKIESKQDLPEEYIFSRSGSVPHITLDLTTGKLSNGKSFRKGFLQYNLLCKLFDDFYRSLTIGEISISLFPEECFDPIYSVKKTHQVLSKLRGEIKKLNLPIDILEEEGRYKLDLGFGLGVRKKILKERRSRESLRLRELEAAFVEGPFQASDAKHVLGLSEGACRTVLKYGIGVGIIERMGSGKSTYYRFKIREIKIA